MLVTAQFRSCRWEKSIPLWFVDSSRWRPGTLTFYILETKTAFSFLKQSSKERTIDCLASGAWWFVVCKRKKCTSTTDKVSTSQSFIYGGVVLMSNSNVRFMTTNGQKGKRQDRRIGLISPIWKCLTPKVIFCFSRSLNISQTPWANIRIGVDEEEKVPRGATDKL